jgi:hypothetical protein
MAGRSRSGRKSNAANFGGGAIVVSRLRRAALWLRWRDRKREVGGRRRKESVRGQSSVAMDDESEWGSGRVELG